MSNVFMVVSSLTKDSNSLNPIMKSNAMRLLSTILTVENFGLIDRHYKQALMDKSLKVQKAALASGIILSSKASEYIKKWSIEIQEALKSEDPYVVYLALILTSILRSADPVMMSKVIRTTSETKGVMAQCQIIKMLKRLLLTPELNYLLRQVNSFNNL